MENTMKQLKQPVQNIVILGDSYSTFEGHIPDGFATYYSPTDERTDVRRVEDTWWYLLCKEMNVNLVQNNSWSGSTVSYTGRSGDCSKTSSFITRLEKLAAENFFEKNKIDTLLILGATNDHRIDVPLGNMQWDATHEELFSVRPAICRLVQRASEYLPNGNVVFIINEELKPDIKQAIIEASEHYGTSFFGLCGITTNNRHPTVEGMKQIKDQVKKFLS